MEASDTKRAHPRRHPNQPEAGQRMLLTGVLFAALAIGIAGCAGFAEKERQPSPYGRGRVLRALEPPRIDPSEPPENQSTLPAETRILVPEGFPTDLPMPGRPFQLTLRDGTIVGGLFFPHPEDNGSAKPLWMVGFGFLQDRWGEAAARFYQRHLQRPENRIDAHVLILDHPSAAPFLAANGMLSLGAYDDARMWIEIGQHLRRRLPIGGIHLLGIGLSGQTVVHALLEDRRLELRLFESGIAVSVVPDSRRYPARPLALIDPPPGRKNPWDHFWIRFRTSSNSERLQQRILVTRIDNQFLPHYRRLNPEHTGFRLAHEQIPIFFHQAFDNRLAVLREQQIRIHPWNPEFSRKDLNAFMRTTRIRSLVSRIGTPLVLLHAANDPVVPASDFAEVARAAAGNPWVISRTTTYGGHADFDAAYGKDYLRSLLMVARDPDVLRNWRAEIYTDDF